MKKKLVKSITAMTLCAAMLSISACGSSSDGDTKASDGSENSESTAVKESDDSNDSEIQTVAIGVWADDERTRLETAFADSEKEIGIKVEFMQYPSDSDFWDNIPAQIAAGTAPDMISCTNEHYLQYVRQDLFEDLTESVESGAISIDGIDETAMSAWEIDGKIYGIPYALNPGVFIVNDDMWQEFGLGDQYPETWEEVLQICKQVKEEHGMPALCVNVQEYHLTNYAQSFGGGWDYGDDIASAENAEALQFIIDAYKEGYVVTPTELGLTWDGAVMIQESALFSTGGAWYQASFEAEAPDIHLKYLQVPKGNDSGSGGTMHTAALVALKNSNLEAATKLIEYAFSNDDLFKATVEVTQVVPAKIEYQDLYKEEYPELASLVDYLADSEPFAYPEESKKFADNLISLMQEAMMDENSTLTGQEIVDQLAESFGSN